MTPNRRLINASHSQYVTNYFGLGEITIEFIMNSLWDLITDIFLCLPWSRLQLPVHVFLKLRQSN